MEGLKIKWSGNNYDLGKLTEESSIEDLQQLIFELTRVQPQHQKLIGVRFKNKTDTLKACKVKKTSKLMMSGSVIENIEKIEAGRPEDLPEIIDDFDEDTYENFVSVAKDPIYLNKIDKRINNYQVKIFNKPRPGCKLLVLDIDYTLFDHLSPAESASELQRPYLHEFLTRAYTKGYDIIIWSATNMKWIEAKMKVMGVDKHENYKIVCYYCHLAMIQVHLEEKGLKRVKPLASIWGKTAGQDLNNPESEEAKGKNLTQLAEIALETFSENMSPKNYELAPKNGPNFNFFYGPKNTIMFDDVQRNFIMNPKNGLRIKPYRKAHQNRETDDALIRLSDYLEDIYDEEDFSKLEMNDWKNYMRSKRRRRSDNLKIRR